MLLKLAEWGGLSYYMLKEETPTKHLVLVKDEKGKSSIFNLEKAQEINEVQNTLDFESRRKALKFIQEFGEDFLSYWVESTKPLD